MVFLKGIFVALAISSSALASPYGTHKTSLKEKLSAPPAGWVHDAGHKIDKDASTIKLRINLVEQNIDKFHETVIRVCALMILQMHPSKY
jgi:tripeptidyl-peptidase-1